MRREFLHSVKWRCYADCLSSSHLKEQSRLEVIVRARGSVCFADEKFLSCNGKCAFQDAWTCKPFETLVVRWMIAQVALLDERAGSGAQVSPICGDKNVFTSAIGLSLGILRPSEDTSAS